MGARKNALHSGYAGNAGVVATAAVALAGLAIGAIAAFVSEKGASVEASAPAPRNAPSPGDLARLERDEIIARIVGENSRPPERLAPPPIDIASPVATSAAPKVIIIIDDMGVDRRASEAALAMPGPITFSFLPYARQVGDMVEKARHAGGEIMLHLPMEPTGAADPGPHALVTGMTGGGFLNNLEWNLTRFDGYVGVNNHMGSKLTADMAAMKTLLGYLEHEGLFFLDSLTTKETAVRSAAREIGVETFARDVFLDDAVGDKEEIRKQLNLAEHIARETGYVVAIGHPRKETLEVLGPWMTSAPARGLELVFASELKILTGGPQPATLAAAPALRF